MFCLSENNKQIPALTAVVLLICFLSHPACYAADRGPDQLPASPRSDLTSAVDMIDKGMHEHAESVLLDIIKRDAPEKKSAYILLGRIYKEKGEDQRAETYLTKAAEAYPLLEDYAFKSLTDIYYDSGQYEKVLETAKRIRNKLLLQDAKKAEIGALFALEREDEAEQALFRYASSYPEDWEYKMMLARFLKEQDEKHKAAQLFKDIYIGAAPLWEDAYKELKELKVDTFTYREILERAGNLFKIHNYGEAEATYKEILKSADSRAKQDIIYKMALSQFRQKKYADSAGSFGRLGGPKSMYYRARSFYRLNDRKGFEKAKKDFEKRYPGNKHLALVFLMEAEEFRRRGRLDESVKSYRYVIKNIPEEAEEALWGLGWMHYTNGDYNRALGFFSRLSYYKKSPEYYKYLYWKARTEEKLSVACRKQQSEAGPTDNNTCDGKDTDYFSGLPSNESYYGYLIKQRSSTMRQPEKMRVSTPPRPAGRVYERIEALSFLGFKEEAVNEITDSIKKTRKRSELLYLGSMALKLDEYKSVIAFAEPQTDSSFLPYSYPQAFWDEVTYAAGSENIDEHLVAALIREESRFDPEVMSWAGAIGLMQLMPSTAHRLKKDINVQLEDGEDLKDVRKNILLGTHYLSKLMHEFKNVPLAIAAYNAGENRINDWLSRFDESDIAEFIENIPYRETRKYVKKVLKSYWQYRSVNGLPVKRLYGAG